MNQTLIALDPKMGACQSDSLVNAMIIMTQARCKSIKGLKFFILKCVLSFFVFSAVNAVGFSFQVVGSFSSSIPDEKGLWVEQQELPFTVSVRNDEWLIQIDYGENLIDYYGCNGTNAFRVLYDPKGSSHALPGAVMEDDYPADAGPNTTLPWLAFCSAKALNRNTTLPAPWALARETPLAYLYEWNVTRYPTQPTLPNRIRFVTNKTRTKSAAEGRYLSREQLNEQAKNLRSFNYDIFAVTKRLGGEYSVLDATNYMGMVLPVHFELKFYDHLRPEYKTGLNPEVKIKYVGKVSAIGDIKDTDVLLPPIDRRIDIVDYRLRDKKPVDFIVYSVMNKTWPVTITEEMKANLESRKALDIGKIVDRAISVRMVFITILILVFISPLVLKFIVKRRKCNETTNKGHI